MPSFKFLIFLSSLFVISLFSLPNGNEAAPAYLYHFCSGTSFTADSTYQSNLDIVLSSLSSNGTRATGFSNASTSEVSGLFLCRGDVNTTVCQDCVATATKEIKQQYCPLQFGAVIWYDLCLLHYSNFTLLDTIHVGPRTFLSSPLSILEDRDRFIGLLDNTMHSLATLASKSLSGKKFATKEDEFNSSQMLYSLVQCTPDLTVSDCSKCIRVAIGQLAECCDGLQGGRVLQPSCIIRYELYPFYNITATSAFPPLPPPPLPLPPGKSKLSLITIIAFVVPIAGSIVLFSIGCFFLGRRTKKNYNTSIAENVGLEITSVESLQFDLGTIEAATNNLSDDNKIGQGGFGTVYKGILYNGQEIAVKRLSKNSGQGAIEFKNEVMLVAKLQHKNLVRLLGFCLEGEEQILIYEYVPNRSLDYFLFDLEKQRQLNWSRRYNIIGGIARGILYLHEDSRLRIIHRDLKASNILLDENMNPKISDFGMARIFGIDQTRGNTNRIVGTYGYMSPEYVIHGQFSVKSDVYSFGVLILEILSGKKNNSFCTTETVDNLLSHAWGHWRHGTSLELLDPSLRDSYSRNEVDRCIHIGLLCVQENPAERPTMASIVVMLSSYSVTLSLPQRPGFFLNSRKESIAPINGLEADQSTSMSMPLSEASITYPR